jgi:hypothetical protein
MYAKDLPVTEQEVSAWALDYSPSFTWKDIDDHEDIVLNTNLIIDWICNVVTINYPHLITLDFREHKVPRINIAGVRVAGGLIPMILVKRHIDKHNVDVQTVGEFKQMIELKFD